MCVMQNTHIALCIQTSYPNIYFKIYPLCIPSEWNDERVTPRKKLFNTAAWIFVGVGVKTSH